MNILLVRFSSFGDLVLTTPLIRAIRRQHPDAYIAFVVREDLAGVLQSNPHLNTVIPWGHGGSLFTLAMRLRATHWDHRLDLHGSLRSLFLRRMVGGHWTHYPKERMRRRKIIRSGGTDGGVLAPVAERYFAAAQELGVTPDGEPAEMHPTTDDRTAVASFLASRLPGQTRPLVALAPGAAHFTKRWPAERWLELVEALAKEMDLVIVGGASERDVARSLMAGVASTGIADATGQFGFGATAALLARCAAVVVGDTGVLHLATAVGTPVVGLYGPTVEAFGFFPYRAHAVVLQRDLPCRPCTPHGGPICPLGHHNCMRDISAAEVARAVRELIA